MGILIIDDSPAQRLALSAMLEEAGFSDLIVADTADGALDLLAERDPGTLNLILTDLYMPDADGIEVCRRVKALPDWRDTPVIVVTSSSEMGDLDQAFAAGAMDYITKPPGTVELLARVRSALRLKRATDERKARERELARVLADLELQHHRLQAEQERSERLLLNILPQPIAERLKHEPSVIADRFECVTVLFADIVGFTGLAARNDPDTLVTLLNHIFSHFDQLADRYGLEKIKTIGDAYMAVAGLPNPRSDHAAAAAAMALEMQRALTEMIQALRSSEGNPAPSIQLRIGLHSGPVIAGVIGQRKFSYDLWGDTVNVASRLESHGMPGTIQISAITRALLGERFLCAPRGAVSLKGRGELEAWYLLRRIDEPEHQEIVGYRSV